MISRILFESPILFVLCWAPVQVVLLVAWSRTRTSGSVRRFWVMAALLPAVLILQRAVATDRERIIERCHSLADSAVDGDVDAIGRALTPGFLAGGLDRDAFVQRADAILQRHRIERPALSGFDVEVPTADRAVAEFTSVATIATSEALTGRVSARFRLTFVRRGDDWLVESIEVVPMATSPIRRIEDITAR